MLFGHELPNKFRGRFLVFFFPIKNSIRQVRWKPFSLYFILLISIDSHAMAIQGTKCELIDSTEL